MYRLYNGKYKNDYINARASEESKEQVRILFDKTFDIEVERSKDVFRFNEEDFDRLFEGLDYKRSTVIMYVSVLRRYIEWAMETGHTTRQENPLEELEEEKVKQWTKGKERYFHSDEIFEMLGWVDRKMEKGSYGVPELLNIQEKVIIGLVFFGVGKKEDLVALRKEHFNKDNGQLFIERDGRRMIVVKPLLGLLEEVKSERWYKGYRSGKDFELLDSPYMLRPADVQLTGDEEGNVSLFTVQNRIKMVKEWTGIEGLTLKRINKSGLLFMCLMSLKRAEEKDRIFSIEFFKEVFDYFGIHQTDNSRYQVLNFVKKELPKVYGEEYRKYIKR